MFDLFLRLFSPRKVTQVPVPPPPPAPRFLEIAPGVDEFEPLGSHLDDRIVDEAAWRRSIPAAQPDQSQATYDFIRAYRYAQVELVRRRLFIGVSLKVADQEYFRLVHATGGSVSDFTRMIDVIMRSCHTPGGTVCVLNDKCRVYIAWGRIHAITPC